MCSTGSNYPELFKFLRDAPINTLMALLFNPLFGVLQGRKTIEAFEVEGQTIIKRQLSEFYPAGYRLWVTLSFINILEPDINLESSLAETLIHMDHDTWPAEMFVKDHKYEDIFPYLPPGVHQKFPSVAESSRLSLYRWTGLSAAVPSVIVHSAATNQYMGIGSRLGMNKWSIKRDAAMLNRKWYSFGDMSKEQVSSVIDPAFLFVLMGEQPKSVALMADVDAICQPDLIIEPVWRPAGRDWVEKFKLRNEALKPVLGTYVVCYQELSELTPLLAEAQDIHVLEVGLAQSKLAPIIARLHSKTGELAR